jgi:RNA polymerase sigma factor (sigma-70 family)
VTVTEQKSLAEPFETHRAHLRGVAYRMLGSLSEAEDAVQEAWLRLSRADTSDVANLRGWLTTVVARVCLDMLRSRKARREDMVGTDVPPAVAEQQAQPDAEHERLMADSVGLAVLVVLETLAPAERLAFVLHDMFAVSFDEIATIVGRSPEATRQLASRARRRVQGVSVPDAELERRREVVAQFLAALRSGDIDALLAVLDPDLVVRIDKTPSGQPSETRGALDYAKGAVAFHRMARVIQLVLIDGQPGLVFAPNGRIQRAVRISIDGDKVSALDIITDAKSLEALEFAVLET